MQYFIFAVLCVLTKPVPVVKHVRKDGPIPQLLFKRSNLVRTQSGRRSSIRPVSE